MDFLTAYKINTDDGFCLELKKGSLVDDSYSSARFVTAVMSGSINVMSQIADDKRVLISKLKEGDVFGISNLFIEDNLKTVL